MFAVHWTMGNSKISKSSLLKIILDSHINKYTHTRKRKCKQTLPITNVTNDDHLWPGDKIFPMKIITLFYRFIFLAVLSVIIMIIVISLLSKRPFQVRRPPQSNVWIWPTNIKKIKCFYAKHSIRFYSITTQIYSFAFTNDIDNIIVRLSMHISKWLLLFNKMIITFNFIFISPDPKCSNRLLFSIYWILYKIILKEIQNITIEKPFPFPVDRTVNKKDSGWLAVMLLYVLLRRTNVKYSKYLELVSIR